MLKKVLSMFLSLALIASQAPVWAQTTPAAAAKNTDLTNGIRQVEEGDFEAALASLDRAVKTLSADRTRSKDLAKAYLYIAIANLGLSREASARARLLDALKSDQSLSLSPTEFPPNVIKMFEEVRQESGIRPAVQAAPTPLPVQPARPVAAQKKGGSKLPIILAVGGAAAVGGVILATAKKNKAPLPGTISVTPGTALMAVTEVAFASQGASDPDNDPLTYSWDFGDGLAGSGANTTHVFNQGGSFTVTLTVSDGKKDAQATATVNVKVMGGGWGGTFGTQGVNSFNFNFVQNGTTLTGSFDMVWANSNCQTNGETIRSGSIRPPRHVSLQLMIPTTCSGQNLGTFIDSYECDLDDGIMSCAGTWSEPGSFSYPATMSRR